MTPLSGKHLMKKSEKDSEQHLTPVSFSTQLVSRLLKLIGRHKNEPSDRLKDLFATCPKVGFLLKIRSFSPFLDKWNHTCSSGNVG